MGVNTFHNRSALVATHGLHARHSGCESDSFQTRHLGLAEHYIHGLYRLSGRALDQIVDRGHDHHGVTTLGLRDRKVADVSATHVTGCGVSTRGQHGDGGLFGESTLE
jgi:hypothetical protein